MSINIIEPTTTIKNETKITDQEYLDNNLLPAKAPIIAIIDNIGEILLLSYLIP